MRHATHKRTGLYRAQPRDVPTTTEQVPTPLTLAPPPAHEAPLPSTRGAPAGEHAEDEDDRVRTVPHGTMSDDEVHGAVGTTRLVATAVVAILVRPRTHEGVPRVLHESFFLFFLGRVGGEGGGDRGVQIDPYGRTTFSLSLSLSLSPLSSVRRAREDGRATRRRVSVPPSRARARPLRRRPLPP